MYIATNKIPHHRIWLGNTRPPQAQWTVTGAGGCVIAPTGSNIAITSATIGKVLDPVADKATQFTLTVCLAIKHPVLWHLAALFVLKEGFQLVAGILAFRQGKMLNGALITGKICTCVLFVSLIVLVLMPNLNPTIINGITIVDGGFMLVSFVHYALVYFKKSPNIQDLPSDDETK